MPQIVDQPAPVPNRRPSVLALVRADLEEREQLGIQRYGTPLQAHNGRDALVDAYQEALDLAAYLRQAIEERVGMRIPGQPVNAPTSPARQLQAWQDGFASAQEYLRALGRNINASDAGKAAVIPYNAVVRYSHLVTGHLHEIGLEL